MKFDDATEEKVSHTVFAPGTPPNPKSAAFNFHRKPHVFKPGFQADSRILSMNMAQREAAPVVNQTKKGAKQAKKEALEAAKARLYGIDTRMLLLLNFPNEKLSFKTKLSYRYRAVRFHMGAMYRDLGDSVIARDLLLLWFAWFVIAFTDAQSNDKPMQGKEGFGVLFELFSSYGNVGLSVGTSDPPNASLSGALSWVGKLVVMVVQIFGKTRSLPKNLDSVLQLKSNF